MLKKLKDLAENKGFMEIPVTNKEEEEAPCLRCQIEF